MEFLCVVHNIHLSWFLHYQRLSRHPENQTPCASTLHRHHGKPATLAALLNLLSGCATCRPQPLNPASPLRAGIDVLRLHTVLGLGEGPQLLQPLGIMLFGGLTAGTLLALNLLPVIYVATERWRRDQD